MLQQKTGDRLRADRYSQPLRREPHAAGLRLQSIAFPCISTGVYGYPVDEAAIVACDAVNAFLSEKGVLREVVFCCFSGADLALYENLLPGIRKG